eukprot:1196072-Prorocentrum_minimum.AAC.8
MAASVMYKDWATFRICRLVSPHSLVTPASVRPPPHTCGPINPDIAGFIQMYPASVRPPPHTCGPINPDIARFIWIYPDLDSVCQATLDNTTGDALRGVRRIMTPALTGGWRMLTCGRETSSDLV